MVLSVQEQRIVPIIITVLLLVLIAFLCGNAGIEEIISFQILSGEDMQTISLWEQEKGRYYVFLPSYAKPENVKIILHTGCPVTLDHIKLENGMRCTHFSEGKAYPFSYIFLGKIRQGELIFLRSAGLATMYIETNSGGMSYIHSQKGNEESGKMTLYLPDGTVAHSGDLNTIQGRGNYTWKASEKKPYSIQLAEAADLLNLGSAQKWVLLANAGDPSHMRNKIIYDYADCVGMQYVPESDWVDLYLNGEYAGLYLLSERNEVHPNRVAIRENGSFLVSAELSDRISKQGYPYVATEAEQYLRIHYPENLTVAQLQEMDAIWQSVENAILAENDIDPFSGKTWMDQIDLDSWVQKYLIEEIFGNYDACHISQFFYCDGNDEKRKICAGPVWDYDNAMGSELAWQLQSANVLYANRYYVADGITTPWFHALYQKDLFYKRVVELYRNDFLPLLNGFLHEHIAACSKRIADAVTLDQIRWGSKIEDICEVTESLQIYMKKRTAFLNRIWIAQEPYFIVKADNEQGGIYAYYAIFPGETLLDLPVLKNTGTMNFLGWCNVATGEPFSSEEPVRQDMSIYARWQNRPLFWLRRLVETVPLPVLCLLFLVLLYVDRKRTQTIVSSI